MKSFSLAKFGCIIILFLSGCSLVRDFQDMIKQSDAASAMIDRELGSRPKIGWNVTNGILTEVNVQFDELADKDITIAELERTVKDSVEESMNGSPEILLVTIKISK